MKILQVVHGFPPEQLAGTEFFTFYLARELSKNNQVYVYCRKGDKEKKEYDEVHEQYDGLQVCKIINNFIYTHLLLPIKNDTIVDKFKAYLTQIKPDIVHFQHLKGLSVSLLDLCHNMGIPSVITLHDYWFMCYRVVLLRPDLSICPGPDDGKGCARCELLDREMEMSLVSPEVWQRLEIMYYFRLRYLKENLNKVDLIITPSCFLKNRFVKYGIPEDKMVVISNGIFSKPLLKVKKTKSKSIRFGYLGTLYRHKGLHILVQAFNQLIRTNNAKLLIHGWTEDKKYLAALKEMTANPNIMFKGYYRNEDLPQILANIDILILPSIWYENYPLVIREALAANTPVIASDIGALPESIRDGMDGLLFRAGDPEDLCQKMRLILNEPGLIEKFRNNIQLVKSIEEQAEEMQRIYGELTKCALA